MFRRMLAKFQRQSPVREDRAAVAAIEAMARDAGLRTMGDRRRQRALIEPYRSAADYLDRVVGALPGPMVLEPAQWERRPIWKALFTGPAQIASFLSGQTGVAKFFAANPLPEVHALLVASWRTKTFLATAEEGGIIHRDVLQKAVFFDELAIRVPSADGASARKAFVHSHLTGLLRRLHQEAVELGQWKERLMEEQKRIRFLVETPAGRGNGTSASDTRPAGNEEARQLLVDMDGKIRDIDAQIHSTRNPSARFLEMLRHPEQYLKPKTARICMGRMGSWVTADGSEKGEILDLNLLEFDREPPKAAVWVRIASGAAQTEK